MFNVQFDFLKKKKKCPVLFPVELFVKERFIKNHLMAVKGWKSYEEAKDFFGLTKSYLSLLDRQQVPATAEVIKRMAYLLGNMNGNWQTPFEFKAIPVPRHQKLNMEKHNGRIPYKRFSAMAMLRRKDNVEIEKAL